MTVDVHCFRTGDGKLVAVRIGDKVIKRRKFAGKLPEDNPEWADFCIRVTQELFVQSPKLITNDKEYI